MEHICEELRLEFLWMVRTIGSHCPAPEEMGRSRRWPSAICGFLLQTPIRPAKQTESESLGAEIADVAGRCDGTNMPRGERMIS